MVIYLEVKGRIYHITRAQTIGRVSQIEELQKDPKASKEHAKLIFQESELKVYLQDLKSSNGTKVNGTPLTPEAPREIKIGDIIEIGSTKLTFKKLLMQKESKKATSESNEKLGKMKFVKLYSYLPMVWSHVVVEYQDGSWEKFKKYSRTYSECLRLVKKGRIQSYKYHLWPAFVLFGLEPLMAEYISPVLYRLGLAVILLNIATLLIVLHPEEMKKMSYFKIEQMKLISYILIFASLFSLLFYVGLLKTKLSV
jgi:pSer/pThr/pTyr-binding forkhead associated (FHA) protein